MDERTWWGSSFSPSISLELQDVQRQGLQLGLLLESKAQPLHPALQPALPVTDLGQWGGEGLLAQWNPGQSGS